MKLSSCVLVSIAEDANENKIAISAIVKYELRGIIFCLWICAYHASNL
jgi:hypothetical protein